MIVYLSTRGSLVSPLVMQSLCNPCGIWQRKTRRALAAAVAATNGTNPAAEVVTPSKPKVQQKDKKLKPNTQTAPCKKRTKLSKNVVMKNKVCFEDLLMSLSNNLAFHQAFPQDEKEAAIILMALSCGPCSQLKMLSSLWL